MSRYEQTGPSRINYDDPVTGTRREFEPGDIFWAQPPGVANIPDRAITELDHADHYGVLTRRTFVSAADIASEPTRWVSGSEGQVKYIDEFRGIGLKQDLAGQIFKRTIFHYKDAANPTTWSEIFETELIEPEP